MTINLICPDLSESELAQEGYKYSWSPTNPVKLHVAIVHSEKRISITGDREEILRVNPRLAVLLE